MNRLAERRRIDQLAALLDGDLDPTAAADDLRSLAALAGDVREERALVAPRPAFRAELRERLLAEQVDAEEPLLADLRRSIDERTAGWRRSARVAVASATASGLLGTAGVAAAAQQALPGQLLYPVKQGTEQLQLALASGMAEEGRVHLRLARERLEELQLGMGLSPAATIATLQSMDASSEAGAEALLEAFDRDGTASLLVELESFADVQRRELTAVIDRLPLEARPFADRSLELLRRIDVRLNATAARMCGCDPETGAPLAPSDQRLADAPRTGQLSAPGEGPAVASCDCEPAATTSTRDPGTAGSTDDGTSDDDGSLLGGFTGDEDGDSSDDSNGPSTTISDPLSDAVDTVTEPIEDVTGPIEEPVNELTEDATDTVTDAVETTTETVDDVVTETTEELGDLFP